MAIPKDPTIIVGDETENQMLNADGSPLVDETVTEEPIQLAMGGKVTKTIIDAGKEVGGYITEKGGELVDKASEAMGAGDALKSPNQKIGTKDDPKFKAQKEIDEENLTNKGESPVAIVTDEGNIWVRQANSEEINTIKGFIGQDADQFDVVLPNLDKISGGAAGDTADTMLKKMVSALYENYKNTKQAGTMDKILRKGERGFNEIIKDANSIGAVDAMLMVMNRKQGDRPFTDAEFLAIKRTLFSFDMLVASQLKKAEKTGSDADIAKVFQSMNIAGYAQIQLVGAMEDVGRTQVSFKIIASPGKSRINSLRSWQDTNTTGDFTTVLSDTNLSNYIEANGGMETIKVAVSAYKHLPTDASKSKFVKMTLLEKAKLTPRMMVEIFQSALLSSGVTHAYNATGQAAFMELLMVERFLSGEIKEGMAMLTAHAKYFPQALKGMAHAFIHEKSITENVSKLDIDGRMVSRHALGLRNRAEGAGKLESAGALFMDGFGISMRALGYRPMIAIDEFFKTMARGMEMESIAVKAKSEMYQASIASGKSVDEAKELAKETYIKTRDSQAVFEQGSEFARMVTFQDDLPGSFQALNGIMNHPLTKIWIPFYKTPTQIVRRVSERSPLGFIMPSVMRDKILNGSPRERKEAMVRLTYGTGLFATLAHTSMGGYDEGVILTGHGPADYKLRRAWLEDHQPYSIGVKQDDGSWDWVSYARYDPLSGVLAMAADFADVAHQSNDDDMLSDLMIAGGVGTMKYVGTSLPMTQFVGEFINLIGTPYASGKEKIGRIRELLAKQVIEAGGVMKEHVMSGGMNGIMLKGTIERSGLAEGTSDELGSEYGSMTLPDEQFGIIPEIGFQREIRAYYQAHNVMCSKTPGCSSKLPPKVNRWFEPVPQTRGTGWEFIQPWRIINKPEAKALNKEFLRLGLALAPLKDNMGEPMIRLNNEQMYRYIELYNNPMASPFSEDYFKLNVFSGGKGLTPEPVLQILNEELTNPFYLFKPESYGEVQSTNKDKISRLKKIDAEYRAYAKALMILEFPELASLVQERDAFNDEMGRNPKYMDKPTGMEMLNAEERNIEKLFGVQ